MPGESGWTCSDYARVLFCFAREAAGAAGTRHSLRPPFSRERPCMTRARSAAGTSLSCPDLIRASIHFRKKMDHRVKPGDDDIKTCLRPGCLKIESESPRESAPSLISPSGMRWRHLGTAAAPADRAHGGKTNEKQRNLAGDAVDRHERRPGHHVEIHRHDQIEPCGKEHQARPDVTEDDRYIRHYLDADRGQIPVHPPRVEP